MSLGLQRGRVELVPYDSEWANLFAQEQDALRRILGDELVACEHIGSTSIPGIKAKPILDIQIAVRNIEDWSRFEEPLKKLAYEFRKNFLATQEHVLFVKGPEECRTYYLKLTTLDSSFWEEHILFRDYLLQHPDALLEYQSLKEHLLEQYQSDREPYALGKNEFIERIIAQARM